MDSIGKMKAAVGKMRDAVDHLDRPVCALCGCDIVTRRSYKGGMSVDLCDPCDREVKNEGRAKSRRPFVASSLAGLSAVFA